MVRIAGAIAAAVLMALPTAACAEEAAPPSCSVMEVPMAAGDLSAEANRAFLEDYAKRDGVSVTPTGLRYCGMTEGTGAKPGPTSVVTVHYRGALINGVEFDSSMGGNPISFPLNRVIPGWTEGLQLMREGGQAELVIPSNLGYGARGAGDVIPPDQTLVFQVELLKVE